MVYGIAIGSRRSNRTVRREWWRSSGPGLIQIALCEQLCALGPDISHLQEIVLANSLLYIERPMLSIGLREIAAHCGNEGRSKGWSSEGLIQARCKKQIDVEVWRIKSRLQRIV